jgi:hypothetical protein
MFLRLSSILLVILALLAPLAQPTPARAEAERGYLWSLFFNFDTSFDAVLTVKVGPWKNGNLVAVDETSTTTIRCSRVGSVSLSGGSAVFDGGHLECPIDLAGIVFANHGLQVADVDSYGSIVLRTRIATNQNALAPIVGHPDADWSVDFSSTSSATLVQELWNNAGPLQENFPGVMINSWHTLTYQYACAANGGACEARFSAGPQTQIVPTAGGNVRFTTAPTTFVVGRQGANTFRGLMDELLIDPGNSVQR